MGAFSAAQCKDFKKMSTDGISPEKMPSRHFDAPEGQEDYEGLVWESLFCEGKELLRWWEIVERVPAFGKPCSTQRWQGQ